MTSLENELSRIADREPTIQAWASRRTDDELRQDATTRPDGLLHGWTLGVKDVIDTSDLRTERGSPIYAGRQTVNDAACVALARQAGALVTGKTRTTEFALFTPTVTTNPYDPTRTPGGSSSGSAAAVADGMVRVAFGTQTVGSVLRPAAFCGVVGFKGTHQLVPMTGVGTLAPSLDTLGWFTRSVADAATMFTALTGSPVAPTDNTLSDPTLSDPPRLGRYRSHQWDFAEPEADGAMNRASAAASAAGAVVVDVEPLPHLEQVFDAADTILLFESARVFSWEREHHWELISPLLQKMLIRSDDITADAYGQAQRVVNDARQAHDRWMNDQGIDALLTPSAPGEAPPMKTTGNSVFNRVWTTLGVPAVQLPNGVGPQGLPLGVQLTGTRWGDRPLLKVAAWVEDALSEERDDD